MTPGDIRVLLIEDNPGDARLVREMLREVPGAHVELECADRLSQGLARLAESGVDLLLLDLGLPDAQGLATFTRLHASAPAIPVVVLSGQADVMLAVDAVQAGAQDYLVKGRTDSEALWRSLRYALERVRVAQALRESQERFRALVESTSDWVWQTDAAGRYTYCSPQVEVLLGYAPEQMLGRERGALAPGGDAEETSRRWSTLLASGRAFNGFEHVAVHRDGRLVVLESSGVPVSGSGGRPSGYRGIDRDITGRKRAQEEIHRMNAELEERVRARTAELEAANRELEAFTHSVSHDLRAPLRHMTSFAAMLREQCGPALQPAAQRHVDGIQAAAARMTQLIEGLLALSRLGRRAVKRRWVDLNQLLGEVRADLEPECQGRRIDWRIQDLPRAECDSALVRQVLANLLQNAVKFTRPRDPAIIEVGAQAREDGIVVFVRDNGVGFDMDRAGRLFGVFERLHRPEQFEGTGVGLATVRRIIHMHGGRVWAEAALDQGATFFFTLGLHPCHASRAACGL